MRVRRARRRMLSQWKRLNVFKIRRIVKPRERLRLFWVFFIRIFKSEKIKINSEVKRRING